jgi:[glutamine synthetase] adenylyltransferase / [glutamine synthetase]-adenylyl-L-tyrosine phosphorylase
VNSFSPDTSAALHRVCRLSHYAARLLAARPELAEWLASSLNEPFGAESMKAFLQTRSTDGEEDLKSALRTLRSRVMLHTLSRDLLGLADLEEVTGTYTALAETAIRSALPLLHARLAEVHGEPLDSAGNPQQLIVVGMGKLGGRELNASSDVDLIFLYPEEGETGGGKPVSNHEFFARLGRKLIAALDEITGDGFVFRVDMRLRPWGDSGPLVCSYAALEAYLLAHGRAWERYAWIKGRALTGVRLDELEAIIRPFVFRKYLDFGAIASLRELHAQIRREVARRELADNIKLGAGGIREIEFIAQVFQIIRGGRIAELRRRPTLLILETLAAKDILPAGTVAELREAYVFLRNLEHRLQYLEDAQTQTLPAYDGDRALIAEGMGFAGWTEFQAGLVRQRGSVDNHFSQIFATRDDRNEHPLAAVWRAPDASRELLSELGFDDVDEMMRRLTTYKRSSRYRLLPAANQHNIDKLMPTLIEMSAAQPAPDAAMLRVLTLLESIGGRGTYLTLLREYPAGLDLMVRLCGLSSWAADYLTRNPILLDELLFSDALFTPPDWPELRQQLTGRLGEAEGAEQAMDALRHFRHQQTFRLLAQDLTGQLAVEALSDHLSALADLCLEETLQLCWELYANRHRDIPRFAIIGYGKLGGKELGYASDLDLTFLYDDDHEMAAEIYAKLAQRLNAWLSAITPAGRLYETDLRLRPDGAAGLLVSSAEAFEQYQKESAWTWEHQALTRARFCAGDPAIGRRFEALREDILRLPRDATKLRTEVLEMRRKMLDGHPNASGLFDLKHDRGGIVDVEFCVQYLVLAHAAEHPQLTDNIGNLALLSRCAGIGLISKETAENARLAYREYRKWQHALKLQSVDSARLPHEDLGIHIKAVRDLWSAVFPESAND